MRTTLLGVHKTGSGPFAYADADLFAPDVEFQRAWVLLELSIDRRCLQLSPIRPVSSGMDQSRLIGGPPVLVRWDHAEYWNLTSVWTVLQRGSTVRILSRRYAAAAMRRHIGQNDRHHAP